MESHNPIDLDGRATQYAAENTAGARPALQPRTTRSGWPRKTLQSASGEVSGGTTRVRCYVVETPVEERVTLQGEKVIVDCCPVTGGQPVAEFTDKTIEMTETNEKPVVSKTARVTDEVSLHKEATDRVETVRNTVRRDEVEIEQVPGDGRSPAIPPRPKSTHEV